MKDKIQKLVDEYIKSENQLINELKELPKWDEDCNCTTAVPNYITIINTDDAFCCAERRCLDCGGLRVDWKDGV